MSLISAKTKIPGADKTKPRPEQEAKVLQALEIMKLKNFDDRIPTPSFTHRTLYPEVDVKT
jgi:hypothetical protein